MFGFGLIIASICGVSAMAASGSGPRPTIKSLNPTAAAVGTMVTINGAALEDATRVTFNGTNASVISDTAARIKVDVPAGATTGYIKVKTSGGKERSPYKFSVLDSTATTTTPASSSILIGSANSDGAVVSGNATYGSPTGTVTFWECGPTASPEPCTSLTKLVGAPWASRRAAMTLRVPRRCHSLRARLATGASPATTPAIPTMQRARTRPPTGASMSRLGQFLRRRRRLLRARAS